MILCTRRALWIGAALSGLGLAGLLVPWALDAMLMADAVLLSAILFDALRAPTPGVNGVSVVRDAPPALTLGHSAEIHYRWWNSAPRRARLQVREVRPEIVGGLGAPRGVRIGPRSGMVEITTVHPVHRGRETAGGFAVDSIGPLGLGKRRGRIDVPWEVRVYPALGVRRLKASVAQALRRRELGRRPLRRLGEGRLFESLREWVPGDDPRHVDWKATARRRKMITRQFEAERRQQVLLVLDAGRLLTAEVAGTGRMEYVVQAALALAYTAVQHDDNIGLMVFADGVQHFVGPQRGRVGLKRVLDVLAEVSARLVEPDYPGAFRYLAVRNRKRALTVVFTDVVDRFASEALVANVARLRPRHLPVAVTLRNPELDALAAARPVTLEDAYRKGAVENLLQAREEALGHMRRAGVVVLDVPPVRAAEVVVRQYLDLKRRGRL